MVTGARMICRSDISKIATASCHGVCFTEWYPDRRIDRESKLFPPVPPNVYRPPFEPSLFFTAAAFFPRCARNYNKCRARNTRRRNITRLGNGVTVCRFLFFFFFCQRIFALERIHPVCIRLHRVPCSLQSSLVFDTVTRSRERERDQLGGEDQSKEEGERVVKVREIRRSWRGKVFQVTSVGWRCWRAVKDPWVCENGVARVPTAIATLDFVALSGSLHAVHGVSKARLALVYTTGQQRKYDWRWVSSHSATFLFYRTAYRSILFNPRFPFIEIW